MKIFILSVYLMGLSALASAQPRPGAFTTITTTSTITDGGLLNVTGFGTSTFSAGGTGANAIGIRNTTAGTGNLSQLLMGNNLSASTLALNVLSSTFTTASINVADGVSLAATGAGGLSLSATNATGDIRFFAGGTTESVRLHRSGGLLIGTSALGLGASSGQIFADSSMNVGFGTGSTYYSGITTDGITVTQAAGSVVLMQVDHQGVLMPTWLTTASAANANVANGNYLRLVTSLRAAKHDIEPIALPDARRTVMGLRAVLYQSAVDDDQRQWAGFIADDVERVNPVLAVYRADGALQSVTYDRIPAFLLPVVQDHEARLLALEKALTGR